MSPREGSRLACLGRDGVLEDKRAVDSLREKGRNKALASASQCRALKRQVSPNSCCPGSTYGPARPSIQGRLASSRCFCWALSVQMLGPLPATTCPVWSLHHLVLSQLVAFPPPPSLSLPFFPIFPDTRPFFSCPLPSPHLQLAFLSFPDHSKSFLTSELLFSSLLTPAGTYAVFLFTRMSIQIPCLTKQRKTPL